MRKGVLILAGCVLLSGSIIAQHEHSPVGSRSAGMGDIGLYTGDVWSAYNNQALMTHCEKATLGFAYKNQYLLKETAMQCIAGVLPTHSGTLGFYVNYFGYSSYNELTMGLAYAKTFGTGFSAGIGLNWLRTAIGEGYGTKNNFTFEAGIYAKLSGCLGAGIHVFNPLNVKLSSYNDERIPSVYNVGLVYFPIKQLTISCEAEKSLYHKINIKAGMEYAPVKGIFLRTGISSNPTLFCFGFGITYKQFILEIATQYHQVLGYSPQASVIYSFN
jgi:hypothetical protein